jgi:hypothetical protein
MRNRILKSGGFPFKINRRASYIFLKNKGSSQQRVAGQIVTTPGYCVVYKIEQKCPSIVAFRLIVGR